MTVAIDRPDELETLAGMLLGLEPRATFESPRRLAPRAALEAAIRPGLRRPPCLVPFSGGRDSSALLAVAAAVARREGLPLPIPATLRFPGPATQETAWQELVTSHLGLGDWLRIELADELDFVGDIAAAGLRRHGQLYPPNSHLVVPLTTRARGGSLLSGLAGDGVFGEWPWCDVADLLARRRPPRARDLRRLSHCAAPAGLRAEILRRRHRVPHYQWLREPVRSQVRRRVARELASEGRRFDGRVSRLMQSRMWQASARNVAALAADHDVVAHAPFLDHGFLRAMAAAGGPWGWGDRTATMTALFGDLLPQSLLGRRSKAEFSQVFFASETQRFTREWDGHTGIDGDAVDGEALRRFWLSSEPRYASATLLQTVWLAVDRQREPPLATRTTV